MRSLHTLLSRWASEDIGALRGESAEAVARTFESLGSVATPDVLYLYAFIGGMEKPDNALWRQWPLAEIDEENTRLSPSGLLFSDYFLSSWCYRLTPKSNQTSAVYVDHFDNTEPTLVAASLEEFFDMYVELGQDLFDNPLPRLSDA